MKKMTLSAALLAVVLMGCSESGLDNSVATTSESNMESLVKFPENPDLKLIENPNLLARVTADCVTSDGNSFVSQGCGTTKSIEGHTYSYAFWLDVNANNQGYPLVYVSIDGQNSTTVDYFHIRTVCVQGCDAYGNCRIHKSVPYSNPNQQFDRNNWFVSNSTMCPSIPGSNSSIGVVSTYAAVKNAGTSDEVLIQESAYYHLDYNQALGVYRNYILNGN